MPPPLQNFIEQVSIVHASWLNSVDGITTTVFEQTTTKPAARTALTNDLPLEIANGGTAARTAGAALTALGALPASSFTQAGIGGVLYPQTTAEIAAGVTPTNYSYEPLNPYRYGANGTGGAADTTAYAATNSVIAKIPTAIAGWLNGLAVGGYPKTSLETSSTAVPLDFTRVPDGAGPMSVFRFFSQTQIAAVLGGSNTVDVSTAVQNANNFLEGTAVGSIATLGAFTAGSGYTNGTYVNVNLTGGHGQYATANITVAGGAVTVLTLVDPGQGYLIADSLSCGSIGAGAGFAVSPATFQTGGKIVLQGGTLYFPPGFYYFGTTTLRVGGNVRWLGAQTVATSFNWAAGYTGNGLQFGPDMSGFYGFSGYYTMQTSIEQVLINMSAGQAYGIYSTGAQQGCYLGHIIVNGLGAGAIGIYLQDHKGSAYMRAYDVEIIGGATCSSASTIGMVVDGFACMQIDQFEANGYSGGASRLKACLQFQSGGCRILNMDAEYALTGIDVVTNSFSGVGDFLTVDSLNVSSAVGVWVHSAYTGSIALMNVNGSNPNIMVQNDIINEAITFAAAGARPLYIFSGTSTNTSRLTNLLHSVSPLQQTLSSSGQTVTPDVSAYQTFIYTINETGGQTIAAPVMGSNPMPAGLVGTRIKITLKAIAAIAATTWNAIFKMSAWTNPANGFSRSIEFEWNGTNWVQLWQATVDVGN